MRYGTVCSGIGAPEYAWHGLGWESAFMSEIEPFPCAVLQHHYPDTPLFGDFTQIERKDVRGSVDLICGGTPCQAFSVAGLRKGFDDDRGNLTLEFVRMLERFKPRWVVWENVPGVLSIDGGRAFGSFLGGLAELGYGFAYRVLDAQYFGVPQRRRRVFVIGHIGDWRPAAAVLFEPESLRGDITPRRETRETAAGNVGEGIKNDSHWDGEEYPHPTLGRGGEGGIAASNQEIFSQRGAGLTYGIQGNHIGRKPENGGNGVEIKAEICPTLTSVDRHAVARMTAIGEYVEDETASTMKARDHKDATDLVYGFSCKDSGNDATKNISPPLRAMNADKTHQNGGGQAAVMYENHMQDSRVKEVDVAPSLSAKAGTGGGNLPLVQAYSFDSLASNSMKSNNPHSGCNEVETAKTLDTTRPDPSKNQGGNAVVQNMSVRRLTPRECERLQGFPDDFTAIPWKGKTAHLCPDGLRYKALGNSMAVPVMRWIGERINMVEKGTPDAED